MNKSCYFTNCYVCTSIIYLIYEYSIVYDLLLSQLSYSFAFLYLVTRMLFLAVLSFSAFSSAFQGALAANYTVNCADNLVHGLGLYFLHI